jgi:uncharacterized protein
MSAAQERLAVAGPAGALEAIVEDPGTGGSSYAVVCHPHPLFGGTMDNKVVTTVARALREAGIPTLRFNFRGVGASAGEFNHGVGETADAQAVAAWGGGRWPGRTLVIAGFSFGACVALRVAEQGSARLLIAVAPAIQRLEAAPMPVPRCPWLIIQGDADEIVDSAEVTEWVSQIEPKPRLAVLPGAGHFFHGRLHELRDAVMTTVRDG